MRTVTLYRPVGVKELELIITSGMEEFPPRLEWQPIFYPVLNFEYAAQIANEWNTKDEFSGYAGFVTAFDIPEDYFNAFKIKTVGSDIHREIWIPSGQLAEFNQNIQGIIKVLAAFYGDMYEGKRTIEY